MEYKEVASKRARSSGGGQAMESEEEVASKRARSSCGGRGGSSGGNLDRLSALPDGLLHAIMSFLKARQAVQTCVLSKRWRYLWRSVPCLDVDQDEFRAETVAPDSDDGREWVSFVYFVDRLMARVNIAQLDTLRLHVNRARAPELADKLAAGWLRGAMKYCTPDPLCQREGQIPGSWSMKRLYLCNVALDDRFANHLTSVCLALEDLVLDDCTGGFRAISSQSLKSLVLRNCRWTRHPCIESPTLESLVISGGTAESYVLRIVAPKIVHLCLDMPVTMARRIFINQTPLRPWSRRRSIHE